jgi:hypothetical protein
MSDSLLETGQIIAIIGLYFNIIGILIGARTFSKILFNLNQSTGELVFTIVTGILAIATGSTLMLFLPDFDFVESAFLSFIFAALILVFVFYIQRYKYLSEILAIIFIVTGFLLQIIAITQK